MEWFYVSFWKQQIKSLPIEIRLFVIKGTSRLYIKLISYYDEHEVLLNSGLVATIVNTYKYNKYYIEMVFEEYKFNEEK